MKKYIVRGCYGIVWQGKTLSKEFALIRAAKTLGYNTLEDCVKAHVKLIAETEDEHS